MTDAIIAVIIVVVAAIPVAGVISYAYSSVVSSADISGKFNGFGDGVDNQIWSHMTNDSGLTLPLNDPGLPLAGTSFDASGLPGVTFSVNGANVNADVVVVKNDLKAGRRNVPVKVYMLRLKP